MPDSGKRISSKNSNDTTSGKGSRNSPLHVAPLSKGAQQAGRGNSVAILLCTYNGDRFLEEQLNSIRSQEHKNITVWASDDGSSDGTLETLSQYSQAWGKDRFLIREGPKKGFAANFLSLACNTEIQADYFAFADQDDIWGAEKLTRAIERLDKLPQEEPAIYSGRTILIDEQGKQTGYSPLFKKKPSFKNALVQSIAAGNTIVMNKAARNLICQVGETPIVSHDWWAYMLITGAGGTFIYDAHPSVLYRQHNDNVIGGVITFSARLQRILTNQFKEWNTINAIALKQAYTCLTSENQKIFNQYNLSRTQNLAQRLIGIRRAGVYRQTLIGNLGLLAATLINKL